MLDADVGFSDVGDILLKGITVATTAIVGARRSLRW
jgi:hypothetical protein